MNDEQDRQEIYEIGYLISSSVPEEGVATEASSIRSMIESSGASVIAEEAPKRQQLAYVIRRKSLSGSYDKHPFAYFGWIKFEIGPDKIESLKGKVEALPSVLRMLLVSTVREATYLGKRAPAFADAAKRPSAEWTSRVEKKEVAPVSIEEMDKSIEEMVKEA